MSWSWNERHIFANPSTREGKDMTRQTRSPWKKKKLESVCQVTGFWYGCPPPLYRKKWQVFDVTKWKSACLNERNWNKIEMVSSLIREMSKGCVGYSVKAAFVSNQLRQWRAYAHSHLTKSSPTFQWRSFSTSTPSSSSSSSNGFVGWYLSNLQSRPLLTKAISSSLIFAAADFTSQVIIISENFTHIKYFPRKMLLLFFFFEVTIWIYGIYYGYIFAVEEYVVFGYSIVCDFSEISAWFLNWYLVALVKEHVIHLFLYGIWSFFESFFFNVTRELLMFYPCTVIDVFWWYVVDECMHHYIGVSIIWAFYPFF